MITRSVRDNSDNTGKGILIGAWEKQLCGVSQQRALGELLCLCNLPPLCVTGASLCCDSCHRPVNCEEQSQWTCLKHRSEVRRAPSYTHSVLKIHLFLTIKFLTKTTVDTPCFRCPWKAAAVCGPLLSGYISWFGAVNVTASGWFSVKCCDSLTSNKKLIPAQQQFS